MGRKPVRPLLEGRQAISLETYTDYITSGTFYIPTTAVYTYATYPLTTIFTPPSSCLAPTFSVATDPYNTADQFQNYLLYDLVYTGSELDIYRAIRSECYPSNYPGNSISYFITSGASGVGLDPEIVAPLQTFYSPGICPSGYKGALTSNSGVTTFITCCPSGYDVDVAQGCSNTNGMATIVNGTSTSVGPVGTIWVSSIAVALQASDSSILAAATATSIHFVPGTIADTSSPTASTITSTSMPTSTSGGGDDLSAGAKAGIGVGVGVGIPLLIGAGVFAFLLLRKKRRTSPPSYSGPPPKCKSMREVDQNTRAYEIDNS